MATLTEIYDWFMTGKKPTQAQFWASWASFWNKSEKIPINAINNLEQTLNLKAETSQLSGHIGDEDAHGLTEKLADKSDINHTHEIGDVNGLGSEIETINENIETNHNSAIQKSTTYTPINSVISLTQVEYDALSEKDATTLYFIQ